ncbi:glycoside hydrolase family 43 protein [Dothidotthia symphoricarpi CBS 119687]|uniref:Endo-1,5-alpha-L-arabinanase A n=1 Tax=Dothidotthia symphoricarpi CBS 119687 TaxID=1392245 RepID=A0A6A6A7N3_9PLEO|nr:glycoside hydrolase family 43 protein [Dothidotthia symphoricarpi CBS 119687]KAF2126661.1 glycoside hydrolase family 43 protein [Dothidotthia symphoricarpi CBS 119687]
MQTFLILVSSYASCLAAAARSNFTEVQAALNSISIINVDDVRGNLYLPAGSDGSNVTWSSSSPSIISPDGIVHRESIDVIVTLTATVENDGSTGNRTFTANVRQAVILDPLEGYAFFYFTGNDIAGEKIYLAGSEGNNALSWSQLNGGQPILTSTQGTKGLRDPFIIRSPEGDTFYLLATDLSIGSGTSWGDSVRTGSLYLEIWESNDLDTWSQQRHVKVSPSTAGNTWAPEAYYDTTIGSYLVFWASSIYAENDTNHTGSTYHRMLYVTTRDFVTFSDPVVWQDAGMSRIDSTVIEENGTFYRFTKDEGASGTGCADIIQERSTSLLATLPSWAQVAACIGKNAGTRAVEGPTVFKANTGDVNGEKFYLFVDEYGGRGYIPLETADIAHPNWQVSSSYTLPTSPRHGTVLPVTAKELASLKASYVSTRRRNTRRASVLARDSPVLPGLYADPNIAIFGQTYYIYPTTDGFSEWGGQVFYVWKSPDLVTWTRSVEPILTLNGTDGNVPWASGNAWAPTIIERGRKFYFYFSGHNPTYNRKTIGVAVADSPEGPFTAQPTAMILNNENVTTGQAIDSAAFRDPTTGKYYLFWGNGSPPLYAELADDMVSLKNGTITAISGLTNFREGIFVNFRAGLFHLTYSIDDTRSENYRVGYATSESVAGPWTYRGVILQKNTAQGILGTGHSSIVNVPGTDDWYIAYHRFEIPGGNGTNRETTVDRLYFDGATGLIVPVGPTLSSVGPQIITVQ